MGLTEAKIEFVREISVQVLSRFFEIVELTEIQDSEGMARTSLDRLDGTVAAGLQYFKSVAIESFGALPPDINDWTAEQKVWTADFIVDQLIEVPEEIEQALDVGSFAIAIVLYQLAGMAVVSAEDFEVLSRVVASNDKDLG
jgi:hypothetical protein